MSAGDLQGGQTCGRRRREQLVCGKKKKHIKTNTDNKTHVAPQMMQSGKCGKELKVCYLVLQQGKKDTERQRGAISGGNNA